MDGIFEINSLLQWILVSFIGAIASLTAAFLIQFAAANHGGDNARTP